MSNRSTLRAAAVQLRPELGNVDANLERSRELVRQAFREGARLVVLPEFFTTGITFDESMLAGHRPFGGEPMQMLLELAAEGKCMVGGSYLAEAGGHVYNTFALARADGTVVTHDKDFPSGAIEHAYYAGGEDDVFVSALQEFGVADVVGHIPSRNGNNKDGVFSLPEMNVGAALCWEMIRHRTVARLLGKVDLVLAGSAWPTIDPDVGFPGMDYEQIVGLNTKLLSMLRNAPVRLAEMLGVPVIHANLVGPVHATALFGQSVEVVTHFPGESRIVDARGKTLANRSELEGEGIVVADICLDKSSPKNLQTDDFWIPEMSPLLKDLWYHQAALGRDYYLHTTVPYRTTKPKRNP